MAYPRDYIAHNKDINIGTAFIIMPIDSEFDMTMGSITEVCDSLEINAQRADDITRQDIIMANILDGIAKSEIIIADITGNNPNVFYELGIAHTLRSKDSIIIITQDSDIQKDTPFDVSHWSILTYGNNKYSFKASLKKLISDSRNFIDSEEFMLRLLKSYAFENGLITRFIDEAKAMGMTNLELSCSILSGGVSTQTCNRDKILELYTYITSLGDVRDQAFLKIAWLLKYLIYTSDFVLSQYIDTIKSKFMNKWQRDSIEMSNMEYWDFVASLCCRIIEKKHKDKADAIEWLSNYLCNARMGRIDKVRTKIEDFMMTFQDGDVDNAVINMLLENNRTAKESAVDICGQKPIWGAVNNLLEIVRSNESDPHIIRSCINALARMKVTTAAPEILKWMEKNKDKWGRQAVSASLMNVAENALQVLNEDSYKRLITLKENL